MELDVSIRKSLRDYELNVDFVVRDEVFALLGASGCGKSMTLKCIAGIERPDAGRILLNGRTLFDSAAGIDLPPQQRRVGYLFQNYALFPNMTVAENILFGAVGNEAAKKAKMQDSLERFDLKGLEKAYPSELSGGQQQRVAFARVLSSAAELLLLDEPFSALDSFLKWQMELELMNLLHCYDDAAVLVSHDRNEVYRLASRIAVMDRGRFEAMSGRHELFHQPQTLAATLLTGCKNVSRARCEGERALWAEEWELPLMAAGNVPQGLKYVGLRAHFLAYRPGPGANTFLMEVVRVIEDTFSYLVMVRRAGTRGKPIRWEVDKDFWQSVQGAVQGQELYLYFPPEQLILLER